MWGDMCNKFTNLSCGQVLAIKSARISDYGGKSLNVSDDHASLYIDLELPETQALKNWAADKS
jgi:hypothetical protein